MGSEFGADIECSQCHERATKVIDTRGRPDRTSIRRRRACLHCGFRFTTFETCDHPTQIARRMDMARRAFEALQHALREVTAPAKDQDA